VSTNPATTERAMAIIFFSTINRTFLIPTHNS
jgi:hypothetical protein